MCCAARKRSKVPLLPPTVSNRAPTLSTNSQKLAISPTWCSALSDLQKKITLLLRHVIKSKNKKIVILSARFSVDLPLVVKTWKGHGWVRKPGPSLKVEGGEVVVELLQLQLTRLTRPLGFLHASLPDSLQKCVWRGALEHLTFHAPRTHSVVCLVAWLWVQGCSWRKKEFRR